MVREELSRHSKDEVRERALLNKPAISFDLEDLELYSDDEFEFEAPVNPVVEKQYKDIEDAFEQKIDSLLKK